MTAEERSAKFSADIDAVERMTRDELLAECRKIAAGGGFIGTIAQTALAEDADRNRLADKRLSEIAALLEWPSLTADN